MECWVKKLLRLKGVLGLRVGLVGSSSMLLRGRGVDVFGGDEG